MKYIFDATYSEEELGFIKKNNCTILSEIKLSKLIFLKMKIHEECSALVGHM